METPETYLTDSSVGTIKELILQRLQHKKGGGLIIDCSIDAVGTFVSACQELSAEFDSRGVTPVFKVSAVAERLSEDTVTIIHAGFALVEASEELASLSGTSPLRWRERLLATAVSRAETMTPEQQLEYLRHNFPDTSPR